MKYKIYHIKGKKVGCTTDLQKRVEFEQGCTREDYDVLFETDDIEEASRAELQLQKDMGYKVDETPYDKLFMKKFKTFEGNTIGFPFEKEEILISLGESVVLSTLQGDYTASKSDLESLYANGHFRKSKFPNGKLKTYVYCRIIDNYFNKPKTQSNGSISIGRVDGLLDNIYQWADNRGILKGKLETQTLKLGEEFGELQKAVLKSNSHEIKDAIGDIIVVLVSIAYFNGHDIGDALELAYDTISKRTGYTNDKGDFIKTHFDGKIINDTL